MKELFETRDQKHSLQVYLIRSLSACGVVLSLSASVPLAVWSADISTQGSEHPVFQGAPIPTQGSEHPVFQGAPIPTQGSEHPVSQGAPIPTGGIEHAALQSVPIPTAGAEPPVLHGAETPTGGDASTVLPGASTPAEVGQSPVLRGAETPTEGGQSPVLHSFIIQTDPQGPTVNTADVRVVAPGTELNLVLEKEIEAGENAEGDEFFGKIIKDVLVDGQVVIPRGTVMHGVLTTVVEPKRAGRNGYINTRFDYLVTPDGRKVSIEGNSTTRDSKGKAAAKVVGRAVGYTAIGGAVGTVIALQFGGLAGAAASHGSTLAGGAAIGGAAGLTLAMLMKGQSVMLPPGAEMQVKLSESLNLPTMTMPDETAEDYSIPGLKVKVASMRYDRHAFGDMTDIKLTLDIQNQTKNTFSSFDIGLEDELGNLFFPSPPGDTGMWASNIDPNTHVTSNITFSVYNVKIRHKLVFFKPYSREPLVKFALTDAMLASGKPSHKGKRAALEERQPD